MAPRDARRRAWRPALRRNHRSGGARACQARWDRRSRAREGAGCGITTRACRRLADVPVVPARWEPIATPPPHPATHCVAMRPQVPRLPRNVDESIVERRAPGADAAGRDAAGARRDEVDHHHGAAVAGQGSALARAIRSRSGWRHDEVEQRRIAEVDGAHLRRASGARRRSATRSRGRRPAADCADRSTRRQRPPRSRRSGPTASAVPSGASTGSAPRESPGCQLPLQSPIRAAWKSCSATCPTSGA